MSWLKKFQPTPNEFDQILKRFSGISQDRIFFTYEERIHLVNYLNDRRTSFNFGEIGDAIELLKAVIFFENYFYNSLSLNFIAHMRSPSSGISDEKAKLLNRELSKLIYRFNSPGLSNKKEFFILFKVIIGIIVNSTRKKHDFLSVIQSSQERGSNITEITQDENIILLESEEDAYFNNKGKIDLDFDIDKDGFRAGGGPK